MIAPIWPSVLSAVSKFAIKTLYILEEADPIISSYLSGESDIVEMPSSN